MMPKPHSNPASVLERLEELIARAFVRHCPHLEWVDSEQALRILLSGHIPPGTYVGNSTDERGHTAHAGFPLETKP